MSARRAGERAAAAPLPCDSAISVSLARAAADFDGCPAEAGRRATAGTALPPSATAVDSRKMTVLSLSLAFCFCLSRFSPRRAKGCRTQATRWGASSVRFSRSRDAFWRACLKTKTRSPTPERGSLEWPMASGGAASGWTRLILGFFFFPIIRERLFCSFLPRVGKKEEDCFVAVGS